MIISFQCKWSFVNAKNIQVDAYDIFWYKWMDISLVENTVQWIFPSISGRNEFQIFGFIFRGFVCHERGWVLLAHWISTDTFSLISNFFPAAKYTRTNCMAYGSNKFEWDKSCEKACKEAPWYDATHGKCDTLMNMCECWWFTLQTIKMVYVIETVLFMSIKNHY